MEQNKSQQSNSNAPAGGKLPAKKGRKEKKRFELTHKIIVTRSKVALVLMMVLLLGLCGRLAYLQLLDPHGYADEAVEQYTFEVKLEAKRGTIYASDGTTKLAVSATTQTVFISPADVYNAATRTDDEDEDSEEKVLPKGETAYLRFIADGLASCLDDFDAQTLLDKYYKLGDAKLRYKYLVVKKDISEQEEQRVREFISQYDLELQIALEEGTKRYYPYSTLASQLLGFVGSDNTGLGGMEFVYDQYLRGTDGRVVHAQDANGNELAYNYESYIEAQDGLNLVTTIDWTIQSTVEKYLAETYADHEPEGRVSAIVMNVDTGEILALAIYPGFDLNNYGTLSAEYQAKLDAYDGDKDSYRSVLRNEMWNNTIATQTYEPGSTFKIITAAMGLENGAIDTDDEFNCGRMINVAGQTIHCHASYDHGWQNVAKALVNSCNPAFASIGHAVGTKSFKEYFENFGYTETTGSDILGEVSSIYYDTTGVNFGELELAVYSFGQTFKVTMLQHIAASSAIANGGYLVTPHIGKYLTDKNGNIVQTFETSSRRQIVSEEVCNNILSYLVNSTKNACVSGYDVVSKTGTSEKRDTAREDDYVSSCLTFAPAQDPQIAVLVTVDTPNTEYGYYGSVVAAPAVGKILTDVLPYLGISPDDTNSVVDMVTVREYIGMTVEEAKESLTELGLNYEIKGDGDTIVSQMPRSDISIAAGGKVILYTGNATAEKTVTVPNLRGSSPESAIRSLLSKGLNVQIEGVFDGITTNCTVKAQSIESGAKVAPGTVIVITCHYQEITD